MPESSVIGYFFINALILGSFIEGGLYFLNCYIYDSDLSVRDFGKIFGSLILLKSVLAYLGVCFKFSKHGLV